MLFTRLRTLKLLALFALAAGLAVGCGKSDAPEKGPDKAGALGSLGSTPADEDPEVVAYLKQKGWKLYKDIRIADGKVLIYLGVENPNKPFEDITITPADYRMLAKSKTVQMLDLNKVKNTDDGLKVIAAIPHLEGIIVGGDTVTDAGLKALAQCRSLEFVSLRTAKVSDTGVKELVALPKLKALYLFGMKLSGAAFEAFAGSKTLQAVGLEFVEGFTDEGAKHLAKLPNLNELKIGTGFQERKLTAAGIKAIVDTRLPAKFEFDKKLIDDDLLQALVAKGWVYGPTPPGTQVKKPATPGEVTAIELSDSKVTDKGLQALLNCTNASALFLERTGVTDETLKKMSAFHKLNYLALGHTKMTAAGLDALTAFPIKHVALQGCELSEDTFKVFGKMPALEQLWLSDAKMKAEWLRHIATLPKLKDLNLMRADFDDAAVKHVCTMPDLRELTLNDTKLGDAGFKQLVALPKLESLFVDGTKVSKEVYQKAKKDHPKLRLYFYRYDR